MLLQALRNAYEQVIRDVTSNSEGTLWYAVIRALYLVYDGTRE